MYKPSQRRVEAACASDVVSLVLKDGHYSIDVRSISKVNEIVLAVAPEWKNKRNVSREQVENIYHVLRTIKDNACG